VTDREDAWDAVHEALPAGWRVGPPTYDPGVPGWSVSANSGDYSRHRRPVTVTGTGVDETASLRALDDRLRGVPQPNGSRMAERERRIRLAYLEGAEAWSRETTGRALSEDELDGVVRRFSEPTSSGPPPTVEHMTDEKRSVEDGIADPTLGEIRDGRGKLGDGPEPRLTDLR
jgi:hypothetical protein